MILLGGSGLALESDDRTLLAALALSAATGRGFRWVGFRGNASGLRVSEAQWVQFFASLCEAKAFTGEAGGRIVQLEPAPPKFVVAGEHEIAIPGDESALPFLRAALLALARAEGASRLTVKGSTHAPGNETFEVTSSTWVGLLKPLGVELGMQLDSAGFLPRGGGEITAHVTGGRPWKGDDWSKRDGRDAIQIVSAAASLPAHVQQRQAARARSGVAILGYEPFAQLLKLRAGSTGSVVAVTGSFGELRVTMASVSERGKSAETVGKEVSAAFRRYAQQPRVVPEGLVDSLLPFLAFAEGPSTLTTPRLLPRAIACAQLVEAFTGRKVEIDGKPNGPATLTIPPSP